MNIVTELKRQKTVVRIEGDLAMAAVKEAKSELLKIVTDENRMQLLFDMSKVDMIDSSGIGLLVAVSKQMLKRQGHCSIFGCNPFIKNVFKSAHIDKLISMYNTEDEAMNN